MDAAVEAAKQFKETPNLGTAMRQLLSAGVSDADILKGLSMAAGLLPMPRPGVATA